MAQVSASERQLALMLALANTRVGMTKAELFAAVRGYQGRPSGAALERQFERDKSDLRDIGVDIEAFVPQADVDDNKESRYRVRESAFGTPEDFRFTASERSLIALAMKVWNDGGFTEESQRAALKLRSAKDEVVAAPRSIEPTQHVRDRAFQQLKLACDRGRIATFDYLKPGERVATRRRVEAWALVLFRGRWRFTGYDRDASDARTFLLSRIVGPVELQTARTAQPVPPDAAAATLETLERIWHEATCTVRVVPGSDAQVRLMHRPDTTAVGDVLTLHHADRNLLADELAGYGADVVVLEPAGVREAVVARLVRIRDAHTTTEVAP